MPNPPLDEFTDNPDIDGDHGLLRRIPSGFVHWSRLRSDGKPEIGSQAFQRQKLQTAQELGYPDRCISLGLENHGALQELGVEEGMLSGYGGMGLARITASQVRSGGIYGLQLVPEDLEPWHVAVFRLGGSNKDEDLLRAHLAREAEWLRLPDQIT